jgi:hypothetical protein
MDNYDALYDREFFGAIDNDNHFDDIQKERVKSGLFNEINEFRRNVNEYMD